MPMLYRGVGLNWKYYKENGNVLVVLFSVKFGWK